jgi:hypothetical protein
MNRNESDDIAAIDEIIRRQFASLTWRPGISGKWQAFADDFFPAAALYPAARPAKRQSVEAFIERMKGLQGTTLTAFHERVLGTEIQVFGNVALAVAACEITENDSAVSRGVEMLLLIKNEGRWQIVSQAWDNEMPGRPIPGHFLA